MCDLFVLVDENTEVVEMACKIMKVGHVHFKVVDHYI